MPKTFGIVSLIPKGTKTLYMNISPYRLPCASFLHTGTWFAAAWSSVLSPSSILLPPSSHCAIIPESKIRHAFPKCYYFILIIFSNYVTMKLRRSGGVCVLFFYVMALLFYTLGTIVHKYLISPKWNHSVGPAAILARLLSNTVSPITEARVSVLMLQMSGYAAGMCLCFQTWLSILKVEVGWVKVNRIREVPVSNFGPKTGHADWHFCVLTQSVQAKAAVVTQIRPGRLSSICCAIRHLLLILPLTV
jgi:hypothetical protein